MFFIALSREEIEHYQFDGLYVVVSVTDPESEPVNLPKDRDRLGVLRLQFPDVEEDGKTPWGILPCITHDEAKEIWEFFSDYRSRIDGVVVNCEAGISRSAGIAAALSVA